MIKFSIQTKIKYKDKKNRERFILDVDLNTRGKNFEIIDIVPKAIDVKIPVVSETASSTEV